MAGHIACLQVRNAYDILLGKPKGKRPLTRRRCTLEINIKIDLRAIGFMSSAQKYLLIYVIEIPTTH
jgi:hypothetical protein